MSHVSNYYFTLLCAEETVPCLFSQCASHNRTSLTSPAALFSFPCCWTFLLKTSGLRSSHITRIPLSVNTRMNPSGSEAWSVSRISSLSILTQLHPTNPVGFFFFFFFILSWAASVAYGSSQAYTTATATPDPSCICDLCHSSGKPTERDQGSNPQISWILVGFLTHWATRGTPKILFSSVIILLVSLCHIWD